MLPLWQITLNKLFLVRLINKNCKFVPANQTVLKANILKYITVIVLLLGILESNNIPVVSFLSRQALASKQFDDHKSAEDPIKESETLRVESAKDYLHQIFTFNFIEPVFLLTIEHPVMVKTKFPFCFYPDVPTPPPNS